LCSLDMHPPFSFLYSPGDHCVLPSFPTRRSSDLPLQPVSPFRWPRTGDGRPRPSADARPPGRPSACGGRHAPLRASSRLSVQARSEEHTSELQSRENLVCRLLLEKKKKRTPTEPI